eukprot:gene11611-13493_t
MIDGKSMMKTAALVIIPSWEDIHTAQADAALTALVQNNPNIHSLRHSDINHFSDESLRAVAQNLPNLHTFCLNNCKASLTGLSVIRASCTKLTTFEVCDPLYVALDDAVLRDYLPLSILQTLHIYSTTLMAELPIHCPCMRDLYFFTNSIGFIRKPLVLEFYAAYRNNSVLCGSQRASQVHSSLEEVIHPEQHGGAPSFSLLPEDLMRKQVLSFLELKEIVRLDSALANHTLRKYLHTSIVNTVLNGVVDFSHLSWCNARKCSAKTLRISSILENDFPFQFDAQSQFEVLEVCTTAKLSEHALHKLLSAGDFKILNIQSFYCMRPHHLLPIESDLSLLEINAGDNLNLREDVLIALVSRCPLLQTVNATAGIYFTERLPVSLSKRCPQLRRVTLYTTSDFGEDSDEDDFVEQQSTGYCELFQSCRQLQEVDCGGDFSLANMQTLADCCKELTSVSLRHWGMKFYAEQYASRGRLREYAVQLEDSVLYALAQYCPSLTSVSITGHAKLSNEAISALSNNAKTCANILDSTVVAIAEHCPLLENIDFSNCPHITNVGINALARCCRRLTNVALRRCRGIQNIDIQGLIRRARYIETLSIARNPQLTFAAVEELPLYCPCMRDVYFFINLHSVPQKPLFLEVFLSTCNYNHGLGSGYCELFQGCRKLQVVHCSGDFRIINLQTLAECCRELTTVTLQFIALSTWSPADIELANAALATLAQNNTNVHSLELISFQRFHDEGLSAVAKFLPNLYTFIASTTTLSDVQLLTVAQANPNIHTLCISSLVSMPGPVLTCNALCKALSHLHQLTTFDVNMFQFGHYANPFALRLEDAVMYALVQNCPKVTSLNISGHIHLRNNSIRALANLPLLRVLNTSQCANLLDSGLMSIAQHCPYLEEVNFSYCTRITNVSTDALAQSCKHLTSVTLRSCSGIRNKSIQYLIRRCRHLQTLDISQNRQLTFAAVVELPQYCFSMIKLCVFTTPRKPFKLEFYASYRHNRRYFDIVFGWSEELIANIQSN